VDDRSIAPGIAARARDGSAWALAGVAALVFAAQLWSQVLWTPTGEGMDVYGHLAYIEFASRRGRGPLPGEPSMRRDIVRMREACLTNAYLCPRSYAEWRSLTAPARLERRAALAAEPDSPYVEPNYQSQHPPAYYWLMSWPYRAVRSWDLDAQVTALSLVSVAVAATAVPAFYFLCASLLPRSQAWLLVLVLAWFPNLMPFLGRVTNDALALPLATWLIAIMAGAVRTRHPIRWSALLLGLGCWTKTYAFTMVPVFLLWCAVARHEVGGSSSSRWRRSATSLVAGVSWLMVFLAPLVVWNLVQTGHVLPLLEAQRTAAVPLTHKLLALFALDPYWFLAGLARNFYWSGYWSFVSPHYLFYLPLATPILLAMVARPGLRDVVERLREVWLHAALVASFLGGLWWHAALFALDAQRRGLSVHSGNEGYYLLALLPSAALLVVWPWWNGLTTRAWSRALRVMVVMSLAWNLAARIAMAVFWGGGVPLVGRERLLDTSSFVGAAADPLTWTTWLSLPGVITGAPWAPLALLVVAVSLTAWMVTAAFRDGILRPSP
jgi:hypothetical protein